MAYGKVWGFLLITVAFSSTQAQQQNNTPDPDRIIFPGPTERSHRFPVYTQVNTQRPRGQSPVDRQPPTTSSPNIASTRPSAAYNRCFYNCQTTSEYNPVCGTDDIVYFNPGKLACAQRCGKQVQKRKIGICINNPRG